MYKFDVNTSYISAKEKSGRRTLQPISPNKRFSFQSDEGTVRTHDGMLRWGEFSNEYVKEARLLKQENEESGWMWWSLVKIVGLSIIGVIDCDVAVFVESNG